MIHLTANMNWIYHIIFLSSVIGLICGDCSKGIPDYEKRDCYPWPDASQEKCEERGCLWCPSAQGGVPWCFADDTVCPSSIPDRERVDCHPGPGATLNRCRNRGCIWCESTVPGTPFCFYDDNESQGGNRCPLEISDTERVDCWPHTDMEITQDACRQRACYWCPTETPGAPWCFMPREHGYKMIGEPEETMKGYRVNIEKKGYPTLLGADINNIRLDVEYQEDARLRVKIYDPAKSRFEVPLDIDSPLLRAGNPLYNIEFIADPFSFKIIRNTTGEVLFDTSMGPLLYSDQGLHLAAYLATQYVYGFGETEHHTFAHDMNYREWGMWARDQPVMQGNLYGVHPYFTNLDSNGDMYGCLILNANAQEVQMTPAPGLIYRTNGGILDLYFFLGPEPEQVIQQYTTAIGKPYMPPYWSLGFQLARYGYDSLEGMQGAVDRMREYGIPHDVQYCDIDCFDRNLIFTYDQVNYAGLPEYITQLREEGTRFIVILDPCIATGEPAGTYRPLYRGNLAQAWVTQADGRTPAVGRVWPPSDVYFPDYSKPSCQDWWVDECKRYHDVIYFDGLWIDMNEPASFVDGSVTGCSYNNLNNPLFKPRAILGDRLFDKTVCTDYKQEFGTHYDVHSLYGWSEAEPSLRATREANPGKRSIVLSRSTFPGAGKWATHWLGDNYAAWNQMHFSIIGMLEFNLFGIPYVGPDICGFGGDTTESLCQRWHQLGAFYTFSRNHNGKGWRDHDPGQWPEVARVTRETLLIRYRMLSYLYTLFHHAHKDGGTVVRPLFFNFRHDVTTYTIDKQFMWGEAFMVTPVLEEGATSVYAYFPNAKWYDYYTGRPVGIRNAHVNLVAPMDYIPLHIRGGYVIPTQQPANSTEFSRTNPFSLTAALNSVRRAQGNLFWDDGDSIDTYENGNYYYATYAASPNELVGEVQHTGYNTTGLYIEEIQIWGEDRTVTDVLVDKIRHPDYTYDPADNMAKITMRCCDDAIATIDAADDSVNLTSQNSHEVIVSLLRKQPRINLPLCISS